MQCNLFDSERERLNTFTNCNQIKNSRKKELAASGFYFIRAPDVVICHFCKLILSIWLPEHKVDEEHLKWSPTCKFLLKTCELDDFQEDKSLCKICLENNFNIVLLPCRHLATCEKCSSLLNKCPICRCSVEGTISVFIC